MTVHATASLPGEKIIAALRTALDMALAEFEPAEPAGEPAGGGPSGGVGGARLSAGVLVLLDRRHVLSARARRGAAHTRTRARARAYARPPARATPTAGAAVAGPTSPLGASGRAGWHEPSNPGRGRA